MKKLKGDLEGMKMDMTGQKEAEASMTEIDVFLAKYEIIFQDIQKGQIDLHRVGLNVGPHVLMPSVLPLHFALSFVLLL